MLNAESQWDELHISKFYNTKEQYIIIYEFKTDVLPIMGGP